ncbi:MAG: DNA/RNA non-specific endonuclease [Flavobacteriales bacterium]|nr:DNA/RNA non-specific endonuclease [Flavobacteriales bacterium]
MKNKILSIFLLTTSVAFSQSIDEQIQELKNQTELLDNNLLKLNDQINELKLKKIQEDIQTIGIPKLKEGEVLINHSAMSLIYSEKHEQAKWVSHIITADIINGKAGRSNDFRADPLVKTGSAIEKDYFLKTLKEGSEDKYDYDGFGYDRGHLAPSADFRWSKKALSESYFYSNMSPQLDKFNREKWADLEGLLRGYIYEHPKTQLYVVTGPLLNDSLPIIERSVNKVSIPKYFFKVVLDLVNKKAIAFIMPNKEMKYPVSSYAVTINEVEKVTSINFFHQLEDGLEEKLETQKDITIWVPEKQKGDVTPLYQPDLPKGIYNTIQAKRNMGTGKKMTIRGTVVDARRTRNGHLFFNLDKSYPNQIFTIAIWKKNIVNFSYDPLTEWKGKEITLKGKIADFDGIPTMIIEKENIVEINKESKTIFIVK